MADLQGVYKRYRQEKREKHDKGLIGSQDSGMSLVDVTEPMPDNLPPPESDEEAEAQEETEANQSLSR